MSPRIELNEVTRKGLKKNQAGSALVIAVFIIIVMSLLGIALVKMLSSSAEAVAYEVIGTRAYTAAQSGAQWQLLRTFPLNNTGAQCQLSQSMPTPSVEGLSSCNVNVACTVSIYDDTSYYTITSTATCNVGNVMTSRSIEIEAKSL